MKAQAALHAFGIDASTAADIRRYRVDGVRVWEYRDYGWFVYAYRHVPEQLVRVGTRSDGREVPIYSTAHYERVATSKKEVRRARRVLDRDPLSPA